MASFNSFSALEVHILLSGLLTSTQREDAAALDLHGIMEPCMASLQLYCSHNWRRLPGSPLRIGLCSAPQPCHMAACYRVRIRLSAGALWQSSTKRQAQPLPLEPGSAWPGSQMRRPKPTRCSAVLFTLQQRLTSAVDAGLLALQSACLHALLSACNTCDEIRLHACCATVGWHLTK